MTRRKARSLRLGVWLAILFGLQTADTRAVPGWTDEDVSVALETVRADSEAPGAILGVRGADRQTRVYAVGLADIESHRAIESTDHFHLGSISKTFTAVLIMQLVEEGQLGLDDPLARFVPEFPGAAGITIRQLLNQTTGLKDFVAYMYYRPQRDEMLDLLQREWTVPQMLELAGSFEPWFQPGERWDYSNTNYFLLGLVAERASGHTFAVEQRRRIFDRLGLRNTWLHNYEPARAAVEVVGYLGPLDFWPHSDMFGELGSTRIIDDTRTEWASGGVVSTASDVLLFFSELLVERGGRLLSEESVDAMHQFVPAGALGRPSETDETEPESSYGFALMRERRAGYLAIGHGGAFNGYSAYVASFPECGRLVSLFVNRGFITVRDALDTLLPVLQCTTENGPSS